MGFCLHRILLAQAQFRRTLRAGKSGRGLIQEDRRASARRVVQTSCFCRAELNPGIKFDKSTAEARRLNQTYELSSASNFSTSAVVLHGCGTAAIHTSCFCRAKLKFINYINVFWRDCVPTGSWEKNCYEASVNPEFGSTLARRLNQSCFPAVLQSNQITIKFGTAEARRLNWALFFRLIKVIACYICNGKGSIHDPLSRMLF